MAYPKDQLIVPQPAVDDPNSLEVVRAWVAKNGLHVSLQTMHWDDPGNWGILLADLARHVGNAYEQEDCRDRIATIARIVEVFKLEIESPTDEPTGRLMDD